MMRFQKLLHVEAQTKVRTKVLRHIFSTVAQQEVYAVMLCITSVYSYIIHGV